MPRTSTRRPSRCSRRPLDTRRGRGEPRATRLIAPESVGPSSEGLHRIDAEAAFRDVLADSLAGLELCDRTLLTFHLFRGLTVDQLVEMFYRPRAEVASLGRTRERLLRARRRGLAARPVLSRAELDGLVNLARSHLDHAVTRLLRG